MEKLIIYKNDSGGLAVVIPAKEALDLYGLEWIAKKDVPNGKPFKIINASDLPVDRASRVVLANDDSIFTDGVGGSVVFTWG